MCEAKKKTFDAGSGSSGCRKRQKGGPSIDWYPKSLHNTNRHSEIYLPDWGLESIGKEYSASTVNLTHNKRVHSLTHCSKELSCPAAPWIIDRLLWSMVYCAKVRYPRPCIQNFCTVYHRQTILNCA